MDVSRSDLMLACLKDGRPWSRREIFERAGFMLTNNAASELRAKGYEIEHVVAAGNHLYRLVSSPASPGWDEVAAETANGSPVSPPPGEPSQQLTIEVAA